MYFGMIWFFIKQVCGQNPIVSPFIDKWILFNHTFFIVPIYMLLFFHLEETNPLSRTFALYYIVFSF